MNDSESYFLETFFNSLDARDYCVLRNYETLPNSLNGSDLDLMVRPSKMEKLEQMLRSAAESNGGKVISEYRTTGHYFKIIGNYKGSWWGAAVDLMPGIDFKGMIYIGGDEVVERAHLHNKISVADDQDVEVMALLKELVNNRRSRGSYFTDAVASYKEYGSVSLEMLDNYLSPSFIKDLEEILKDGVEDSDQLQVLATKMRKDIYRNQLCKQFGGYFSNQLRRFSRIFKPAGMSIAIVGTDGAGKTTVINEIKPILETATHMPLHYEHLRPNWLPALGKVAGKESNNGGVVTDPHGKKPSGLLGSLVRLIYYSVDYTFGYWKKTYPRMIKKAQICVFDRYFYDIIADPLRMRLKLPRFMLKSAFLLAPEPKIILCLGADAELIYQRKPETSLEEVSRQVEHLKQFCDKKKRAYWIDTGKGITSSVDDVLEVIMTKMSNRYSK